MQSQDPMDNIRSAVEHADKNPSKVVSYSWYLVLVSERKDACRAPGTPFQLALMRVEVSTLVVPMMLLVVPCPGKCEKKRETCRDQLCLPALRRGLGCGRCPKGLRAHNQLCSCRYVEGGGEGWYS